MRVLVACEFSGVVREAFRKRGHDAWSCDLLPTEIPGNHIQGDVLDILDDGWDLMIAHPPCTYLSKAGMHYLKTRPERYERLQSAFQFVLSLWNANIEKICIENPVGWMNSHWMKPTQIIHPYYFGDPEYKETCLWLKGLTPLWYWLKDDMLGNKTSVDPRTKGYIFRKSGKRKGQKYTYHWRDGKTAKDRSVTFQCIADAMAEQWG